MNKYKIGFVGSGAEDEIISAETQKKAKRKFADKHNVVLSSYIVAKRS